MKRSMVYRGRWSLITRVVVGAKSATVEFMHIKDNCPCNSYYVNYFTTNRPYSVATYIHPGINVNSVI